MKENTINIRDGKVKLHYRHEGEGPVTLLFVHGWCIHGGYWESQLAHFGKSYSVYAIDLPGFGKSSAEREEWTIGEYGADVIAFVEALDLEEVVLVGHSMSGDVVLEAALAGNPRIRGLVGIDNFLFVDAEVTAEQQEFFADYMRGLATDFRNTAPGFAEMLLLKPSTPSAVRERVTTDFRTADPAVGYSSFANLMQYPEAQKLEQLPFTLHLLNSDLSPIHLPGLEKRCPKGYQVRYIHDSGHYPMVEQPAEFNRILGEILEKV